MGRSVERASDGRIARRRGRHPPGPSREGAQSTVCARSAPCQPLLRPRKDIDRGGSAAGDPPLLGVPSACSSLGNAADGTPRDGRPSWRTDASLSIGRKHWETDWPIRPTDRRTPCEAGVVSEERMKAVRADRHQAADDSTIQSPYQQRSRRLSPVPLGVGHPDPQDAWLDMPGGPAGGNRSLSPG